MGKLDRGKVHKLEEGKALEDMCRADNALGEG